MADEIPREMLCKMLTKAESRIEQLETNVGVEVMRVNECKAIIERQEADLAEQQKLCDGCRCVDALREALAKYKADLAEAKKEITNMKAKWFHS